MPTQRHVLHSGGLRLTIAADTQVGHRYDANFDVLAVDPRRPLVAVADGMGAGPGSAAAGRITMETILERAAATGGPVTPRALREWLAEAQRRVRAAGAGLGQLTGCTFTALVVEQTEAWIVQIGDSRAYRLRGGVLELLTTDHTAAWLGTIHGWYAADSPAAETARYRLHRYVGHPDEPEPDVLNLTLRDGDVLCLCTDGLAEQVPYHRLAELLGRDADPTEVVADLLADALAAGGRDNATVAVARVARPG